MNVRKVEINNSFMDKLVEVHHMPRKDEWQARKENGVRLKTIFGGKFTNHELPILI